MALLLLLLRMATHLPTLLHMSTTVLTLRLLHMAITLHTLLRVSIPAHSIPLHLAILALTVPINVCQRRVRQNRITQILERLDDALARNRTRIIPPLDVGIMRVEVTLMHALEEL